MACPEPDGTAEILEAIKRDGGIFVSGIEPTATKRGLLYRRSLWDVSFWIAYLGILLLIAAVAPWHLDHGHLRWAKASTTIFLLVVALVLAAVNWLAGGCWMVAVIELSMQRADATYHQRLASRRERSLDDLAVSGPTGLTCSIWFGFIFTTVLFEILKIATLISWPWWWLWIAQAGSVAVLLFVHYLVAVALWGD